MKNVKKSAYFKQSSNDKLGTETKLGADSSGFREAHLGSTSPDDRIRGILKMKDNCQLN